MDKATEDIVMGILTAWWIIGFVVTIKPMCDFYDEDDKKRIAAGEQPVWSVMPMIVCTAVMSFLWPISVYDRFVKKSGK